MLQVWSNLAEKYAKPLDEDDIVDLENETIIKDRGIIRSSGSSWNIGCFADDHELERQQLASEDEPDEIDAFAENASRSETDGEEDDFELARPELRLPPVRELDPADAADLAEFMEAERRRKDLFGDIDEEFDRMSFNSRSEAEYDDDDIGKDDETQGEESQTEQESHGDEEEWTSDKEGGGDYYEVYEDYEMRLKDKEDGTRYRAKGEYRDSSTPSGSPEIDFIDLSTVDSDEDGDSQPHAAVSEDDIDVSEEQDEPDDTAQEHLDSDDELGGWEHDEGTSVYELADPEVVEIIEDEDNETSSLEGESTSTHDTSLKQLGSRPTSKIQKTTTNSRAPKVFTEPTPGVLPIVGPESVQLCTPPRSSSSGLIPRQLKDNSINSHRRSKVTPAAGKSMQRIETSSKNNISARKSGLVQNGNAKKPQTQRQQVTPNSPNLGAKSRSGSFPEVYIDVPPLKPKRSPVTPTTTVQRQATEHEDESTDYVSFGNFNMVQGSSKNINSRKGKERAHDESRTAWKGGSRAHPATLQVEKDVPSTIQSAKSQGYGSHITSSVEANRVAKKRRRESSPLQVMEADEYAHDYAHEDVASQPSTTVSVSPSPPPHEMLRQDRISSFSSSSYSHDDGSRYGALDFYPCGAHPQMKSCQLNKTPAPAHANFGLIMIVTVAPALMIAMSRNLLLLSNLLDLILGLVYNTLRALPMIVEYLELTVEDLKEAYQRGTNLRLPQRCLCRHRRPSSIWPKLHKTCKT